MLAGPIGLLPDGVSLYYGELPCSSYRTLMVQVLAAIIIPAHNSKRGNAIGLWMAPDPNFGY